ncbi:MAG TPA: hypothetical protein VMB22_01635 [Verrucomicrobiae bacterium]|nr:hypothetical protein [Verrucomicrobiae bacterium]
MVMFAIGSLIWAGCVNVAPALTLVMPVGAIAFGMFMITLMLEKEMAGFDAEEAEKRLKPIPVRPEENKLPHDR